MKSNQCIVDWQPFDEYTIDSATHIGVNFNMTFKLEPVKDGTHLINLWGKARGAWILCKISDQLQKLVFVSDTDQGMELLRQRIQQDLADGTAFVSPPIQVDKAQITSVTTQVLTHGH